MLVILIGFPTLFVDYHRQQIEHLAQRTGRFEVEIRPASIAGARDEVENGAASAKRLKVAVDLWRSASGNQWHVAKPATDSDEALARAYHDAVLREMIDPRFSNPTASAH